jgi:hypothetical protein
VGHARPVGYEWLEPSGGRLHAPGSLWWLAAVIITVAVLALLGLTVAPVWPRRVTRSRRAALLGAATGICWGFEAAVIKEFSSRVGDGLGAIVSNGFTILDPLAASFLGVFLFGERVRAGLPALAGEALARPLLIAGVSALGHSHLATREGASPSPGFRDYPPTGPR